MSAGPTTVPKASAIAEWEAGRRAADARYWAARFDEFEKRLPRLRRICGEATAARLVDDVLKAIAAAEGPFNAWQARKRLTEHGGGE